MSNSKRYTRLLNRIKFLERNILPAIKTTGNYTKKDSDLTRAYILLVHAEIESYFEDIARKKVEKSLNDWDTGKKKSNCLIAIALFISSDLGWRNKKAEDIHYRMTRSAKHYFSKLTANHGIKSENIYNILLPIGIEANQLDNTWLNTMDNFGNKRGLIAHSTISVQTQIDPVSEKNNINNNIIPEIKKIDLLINRIT